MIDTHCHLDFYQPQVRDNVIQNSLERLDAIITVGTDPQANINTLNIAQDEPKIYAALGLHPHLLNQLNQHNEKHITTIDQIISDLDRMIDRSDQSNIVAIGETGLDYNNHIKEIADQIRSQQRYLFEHQIKLARQHQLPLIVHSRDSINDTLDTLKNNKVGNVVIHCFTYNKKWAQEILDLGYLISFTGIISFDKAQEIREAARYVPLDSIMLETDAPYLAPVPFRGKQCKPWMVALVAEEIAKIKGCSTEEIEQVTDLNAKEFFKLT